jgi:DNA-binding NtrC family response regulator
LRTRLLWIGADSAHTDSLVRGVIRSVDLVEERFLAPALHRMTIEHFDLVILTVGGSAHFSEEAVEKVLHHDSCVRVIVHHATGTVDDAIQFTRQGAFYVLLGEIDPQRLEYAVNLAVQQSRFTSSNGDTPAWRRSIIGRSHAIVQICDVIQLVASKRCTILITGETGTGKEVIAKAIHSASNRAAFPWVAVNCTALPANLIETELFGHAKGAFTGAHMNRVGRFEQAHRGSIFLDEIGDLPLDAQAKLLRVLQEQEFQRVGSSETVRVDVRVIAASNVDLEQAARERRFREDVYYRLNVVPIHMPPLRERREDIALLLDHFLEKIRIAENVPAKEISRDAVEFLTNLEWPGNVRQLEHAVQMAFALSGDRRVLHQRDFYARHHRSESVVEPERPLVTVPTEGLDFDEVVSNFERSLLNQALAVSGGNKARAADLLRIKRTTLLAKLKALEDRENQAPVEETSLGTAGNSA